MAEDSCRCAARQRLAPALVGVLVAIAVGFNLIEYGQWAAHARRVQLSRVDRASAVSCAPGTLVQGKLANGLALDNRIRPIFVGNGFGNYADRLQRDDVRYILTYTLPRVGYESGHDGRLITELLDAVSKAPRRREFRGGRNAGARSRHPHRQVPPVREIRDDLIKAHADRRFRSEYDYALFEYYRSAKVIAFLERAGVTIGGRVLDAGCGGGGMPLSLAEHATHVVGIDPIDRFGTRASRSAASDTPRICTSRGPTAWRCPFPPRPSIWCCRMP